MGLWLPPKTRSVLHTGLLNLSGTKLERTGAAFGQGIYLSTELTVAYSFCEPADVRWPGCSLGRRLRCLLLCGVEREHAQQSGTGDAGPVRPQLVLCCRAARVPCCQLWRATLLTAPQVPDRYLVVVRSDVIQLLYAFIYFDDAPSRLPAAAAAIAAAVAQPLSAARQQRWQHQRWWRVSPWAVLFAAYLLWILSQLLHRHWPWVRRVLRRQLGIRLL